MDLGSLLAKGAGAGTIRQRKTVEQSIRRSILKPEKLENLHDWLTLSLSRNQGSFPASPSRHTDTDPRGLVLVCRRVGIKSMQAIEAHTVYPHTLGIFSFSKSSKRDILSAIPKIKFIQKVKSTEFVWS